MRVGVGYSDNPDTIMAGMQAAMAALRPENQTSTADGSPVALSPAERRKPCDLVLLFSTARHDAAVLREAITSVLGAAAQIVGGGCSGAICNDKFGYAGDQVVLAAIWLDGNTCNIFSEGALLEGAEELVGRRLGQSLAKAGVTAQTPVLLFYDAIDSTCGAPHLVMSTPLLAGIEESMGFLPKITGAGMFGDYTLASSRQWTGQEVVNNHVLALTFGGQLRVDTVIMHGCRPATGYYTVTKADKQTILEINGQPALLFLSKLLGPAIPIERFPFFLILGINCGGKWEAFNENNYISRLCLALDEERQGIVMFEPDMVEGTEFQIMYRSLDLAYIQPRIEDLFSRLNGRHPVLAMYINCAGRAAGYAGLAIEDASVVNKAVAGRAPLFGMYNGVEIASVGGRPHGLDWTGVFSLFSVSA